MDLHDDDKPVGRVLSRREVLALLGGGSAALLIGGSLTRLTLAQTATPTPAATEIPSCIVRPELTEGPYFVDGMLNRSDIRIDPTDDSVKEGLLLKLEYRVSDVTGGTCTLLENAQVDVWHCDADGVYSGVQDSGFDTSDQVWLRGYQLTDADGIATFITIVPGWYSGRAVHIHFKIRTEAGYEFTSQFFFDPELIETIYEEEPYAAKGSPDTPNDTDNIYQGSDGLMVLDLVPLTEEELEELEVEAGYSAVFSIGLDLSDEEVGASDSAGGGGGPGGRP
jgi:protocatechuate 3,4-dioxygenase beta subunit